MFTSKRKSPYQWVAALTLVLALVITTNVVALAAESSVGSSQRAPDAMSARYQPFTDHESLSGEAQLEQYWSATADRYQAMADSYLSEQTNGIESGWAATAARYQALADDYQSTDQ